MSIMDGFKFWIGKELGELVFAIGVLATLAFVFFACVLVTGLRARWRRWRRSI